MDTKKQIEAAHLIAQRNGFYSTTSPRGEMAETISKLLNYIEELEKPTPCSVCLGKPINDKPCICNGIGTIQGEVDGLRQELFELDKE